MAKLGSRIVVHEGTYDSTGFTDQNTLVRALMERPDQLTPAITMLMGNWSNKFPLSTLTEGQSGNAKAEEVNNIQYEYPIIGKMKRTETVAETTYTSSDKIGIGHGDIFLVFRSSWFPDQATISSTSGAQCRVMGFERYGAVGFRYRLRLFNPSPLATLAFTDCQQGAVWGRTGGSTVTESLSTGNSNPVQSPGKRKNQISILRESYRLAGNISNKIVEFQLMDEAMNKTSYWLPWEEFQHRLRFKELKEMHLWLSEYTRADDGSNPLMDERLNQIIPVGAGLKQQIPNEDTYSSLTSARIRTIMGDVFRGASDTDTGNMDIVCYTGDGGFLEWDSALKNDGTFKQVAIGIGDKFVKSVGGGLQLGGYFVSYQHTDGRVVTIKNLPFLNDSAYAEVSGRHPITGYPMSSYEFYFVDQSVYDGKPNLRYIHQKGRMEIRGVHQGMTLIKGSSFGDYNGNEKMLNLGTEQDQTSIHFLSTCGIQLMRDTHSFKLRCVAS